MEPAWSKKVECDMTEIGLREKWMRFYDVNSDVRTMIHVYYTPGLPARPWPWPDNEDDRVEWSIQRYEIMGRVHEIIPDDQIPFLSVYTGTEIFAQSFGCRVHYPEDNMPFALPRIHSAREVRALRRPSAFAPPLERAFRIARRLKDRYPDALLGLPDIQSPFDIAALVWAKEDFYVAAIEEPDAVTDLCAMVEEVLVRFLDAWFREFGTEYIAHYPDLFVRGGMTLSEDEAGAISPAMFRQFCLPALERLSERYGGISVHCCADSERQWDNFARIPNMRLINLNQPDAVLSRAYKRFSRVAAQIHMRSQAGSDPEYYRSAAIPEDAHVVLFSSAGTQDEAMRIFDELKGLRGQK